MASGRFVVAFVVAALTATCVPGQAAQQPNAKGEIAIAAAMPLAELSALATMKGVRFALERTPTVRGYRLTLRSFDNSLAGLLDPAKALQNLKQIIDDPAILGLVEASRSVEATYEIPLAEAASLAMLSPATQDCLTIARPDCFLPPRTVNPTTFFRVATPDRFQATAMADYASSDLRLRKVAVITDGLGYGDALADSFSKRFADAGGTIVLRRSFQPCCTPDFAALLQEVKQSNPDALYIGTGSTVACKIRGQMKDVIPTDLYFLGPDRILDDECLENASESLSPRMIATSPAPRERRSHDAVAIVDAYRKAHPRPEDTGSYTFAAYDGAMILIDAIGRAIDANGGRLPSRSQVVRQVAQTPGWEGVTGTWSFDANGDPRTSAVSLYQVQERQWRYLANVSVKGS